MNNGEDNETMILEELKKSLEESSEKDRDQFLFNTIGFELNPSPSALPCSFKVEPNAARYPNRPRNFINQHQFGIHLENAFPVLIRNPVIFSLIWSSVENI